MAQTTTDPASAATPPPAPTTAQKLAAEVLGTFVLVFFGVGAALATGGEIVTTGLTFGLTVLVMVYALGRVSGGHFNPAVTVGAAVSGRLAWSQVPAYVGAQLVGAIAGSAVLWGIWQGFAGFSSDGSFGQNSFGSASQTGLAWWSALLVEVVTTLVFLMVILAVTDERNEHPALAPLAIGLSLAMIHFATIALTGTSVNPARSIGPALFAGTEALQQLWLFIVAPLVGGALAGIGYPLVFGRHTEPVPGSGWRLPRRTPGAVPGYGAPDAYQQQWNQQYAGEQFGFPGQPPATPGQQSGQQPWPPQPPQAWQQPQYPTGPMPQGWPPAQPNQPPAYQPAPPQVPHQPLPTPPAPAAPAESPEQPEQPAWPEGDDGGQTQVRPPT